MKPISIHYRLTESEFMAACNDHWTAHRQGTRRNLIAGTVGLVASGVAWCIAPWLALLLALVAALLLLITVLRLFLWRRAYREAKKYNEDIHVVLQEDSIHVESADGRSELKWAFYSWYLDAPKYLILYMTKRSFSVLPLAAFEDDADRAAALALVKSKLPRIK